MNALLILFATMHTARGLVTTCPAGQSCVPFIKCREWCQVAQSWQLEKNITVRRQLLSSTCKFAGDMPRVCCQQASHMQEQVCDIMENSEKEEEQSSCGQDQAIQDLRCVGCNSISPGDWPWMARLLYKDNIGQDKTIREVIIKKKK